MDEIRLGANGETVTGARESGASWNISPTDLSATTDSPSPPNLNEKRPSLDPFSASFSQATPADRASTPSSPSLSGDVGTPRL